MGYDCPCGASVGTRAHWCEWLQERHAERLERIGLLQVAAILATTDEELATVRAQMDAVSLEAQESFG